MDGKKTCLAEHNAAPPFTSQSTIQPPPIHLLLGKTKSAYPKEISEKHKEINHRQFRPHVDSPIKT